MTSSDRDALILTAGIFIGALLCAAGLMFSAAHIW